MYFFVPFTLVSGVGVAVITWLWIVGVPCDAYQKVDFFDLGPSTRCVVTSGNAHYEVVVTQTVPGNGFFDDQTYYVYGHFPTGNIDEREVRVLVRTKRPPERYVSFEEMTITGKLLPMDYRKIPFDTEIKMGQRSNYFFPDRALLLEPDGIQVSGEEDWVLE